MSVSIVAIAERSKRQRRLHALKYSDKHGMPLATMCAALRTAYFKTSVGRNCFLCQSCNSV